MPGELAHAPLPRAIAAPAQVLRAARASGDLPVYRLGERWARVRLDELDAWVGLQRRADGPRWDADA